MPKPVSASSLLILSLSLSLSLSHTDTHTARTLVDCFSLFSPLTPKTHTPVKNMSIIMAGNVASLHYPNSRMGSMVRKTSMYPTASMETRIHRLIKDHGTVLVPGCYDAISAAILEKTGFRAGFISGYSLSASLLAKPDLGFLTSLSLYYIISIDAFPNFG